MGSQSVVAKLLGVHPRTISKRETGELEINREAELAIRHLATIRYHAPGRRAKQEGR